jgi:hypothetical protein
MKLEFAIVSGHALFHKAPHSIYKHLALLSLKNKVILNFLFVAMQLFSNHGGNNITTQTPPSPQLHESVTLLFH